MTDKNKSKILKEFEEKIEFVQRYKELLAGHECLFLKV